MSDILYTAAEFDSKKSSVANIASLIKPDMLPIVDYLPSQSESVTNTIAQLKSHIGACITEYLPKDGKDQIGFVRTTRGMGLTFRVESKTPDNTLFDMSLHIEAPKDTDSELDSKRNRSAVVKRFKVKFDASENLLGIESIDSLWEQTFAQTAYRASQTLNASAWNSGFNKLLSVCFAKKSGSGHIVFDKSITIKEKTYSTIALCAMYLDFAQDAGQSDAVYHKAKLSSSHALSLLSVNETALNELMEDASEKLDPSFSGKLRADSVANSLTALSAVGDNLNALESAIESASDKLKEYFAKVALMRQVALEKWTSLEEKIDGRTTATPRAIKAKIADDKATHVRLTKAGIKFYETMVKMMGAEKVLAERESGSNMTLTILGILYDEKEMEFTPDCRTEIADFNTLENNGYIALIDKSNLAVLENRK